MSLISSPSPCRRMEYSRVSTAMWTMFSRLMMAGAPPSLMNILTGSMTLEAKRMNSAWGTPGRISRRLILRKWKSWARSM